MSRIFVHGSGVVSPAGWGMASLRDALTAATPIASKEIARPGWAHGLRVRQVPAPVPRPAFTAHARLRRTSPVTQYATAAALEALGDDAAKVASGEIRLGVVLCVMSGCVNYSRRFFDETLRDPATASPLVFPETVFNAPASHIAALLGTTAVNYTLVGDPGTYLQGLELAADWLADGMVDGCLVIGAEEGDWLTADAFRLFAKQIILGDGAGALFLRRETPAQTPVELQQVTQSFLYLQNQSRGKAAQKMRNEMAPSGSGSLLCDGLQEVKRLDLPELEAWRDWAGSRVSPKKILGEGLMAAAAWQCVTAVDALRQRRYSVASVSVVGCNQQAIGARFGISG